MSFKQRKSKTKQLKTMWSEPLQGVVKKILVGELYEFKDKIYRKIDKSKTHLVHKTNEVFLIDGIPIDGHIRLGNFVALTHEEIKKEKIEKNENLMKKIELENLIETNDQNAQCKICFNHIPNVMMNCKHVLCSQCLYSIISLNVETNPPCPHCRTFITKITHFYM